MEVAMIYDLTTDTTQDLLQGKATDNATLRYAIGASETHPFDRMEQALHALYDSVCGVDERAQWKLIHEYPLSGTFPFMTHVLESDGKRRVAAKGSAEGLFQQAQPVAGSMEKVHEVMQGMMAKGYRVLAVAGIPDFQEPVKASQFDYRFTLLGLIGFYDPPRKNMAEVITGFYNAGVQVRLLTGDHPLTAHALARQVGIRTPEKGLTGAEVTAMDDEQLKVSVRDTVIYSRMFPEAKLRVVKALMANGEVVAMTGDGVNDAPALKRADIGIALDGDADRRAPRMGVEHMRAEAAVHSRHSLPRNLGRQTQPRDEEDFLQGSGEFGGGIVPQPALELGEDRIARVPADADDEGEAELRLVGVVEAMEAGVFLLGERIEADARLLVSRILGDSARPRRLAGEIGMAAHEGKLALTRRGPHRAHHRFVQGGDRGEGAFGGRGFGDPRRQFERIADSGRELAGGRSIEVVEAVHHAGRPSTRRSQPL
jgi:phosphoserine phosphatase